MIRGDYLDVAARQAKVNRLWSHLMCRTALGGALSVGLAAAFAPRAAQADPTGGVVAGGQATIQQAGTHTQINQASPTAIINWQTFGVDKGSSVNFAQPDSRSLTINRVQQNVPSNIAGELTANGNVWIENRSGVFIRRSAQINVGGLMATTARIDTDKLDMTKGLQAVTATGAPDGSVISNDGVITADDGAIVIVAPVVDNSGDLTAKGGDVALGAGAGFTVDFDGDGLTRFEVQPGNGVSLTNSGTISAEGGAAYISAASAETVQSAVVSIGGKVEATRIEERGGVVVISGGENGITEVTGEVTAAQSEGNGGRVIVTGENVDIAATAKIDASGARDGGTVEIGGGYQGAAIQAPVVRQAPKAAAPKAQPTRTAAAPARAPVPTAKRTRVQAGATIAANAGETGDGGTIIVWADEITGFAGQITARGGFLSGDGGFAEVSGKQRLMFAGQFDLSAPQGAEGTLLLDPLDIVIAGGIPDIQIGENDALFTVQFDDGDPTDTITLNATQLGDSNGTVVLQATRDILVQQNVNKGQGDLTLQAGNNIALSDNVSLSTGTGALVLEADSAATPPTDPTDPATGGSDGNGTVVFGAGSLISSLSNVTLSGNALDLGTITVSGTSTLSVTASDDNITQRAGSSITAAAATTAIFAAGTGNITLDQGGNDFAAGAAGALQLTGGTVSVTDANALQLGTVSASGLSVTAGGTISQASGSSITAGGTTSLTANGAGDILLGATTNDFDTIAATATDDTVQIGDADDLVLGSIDAADLTVETAAGSITQASALSITGTTSLIAGGTGDITLDTAANDFGTVAATASDNTITLVDANDLVLGAVTASTVRITADEVTVGAAMTLGTDGTVSFTNTSGSAVTLGPQVEAGFDLSNAELANISGGLIEIDSGGQGVDLSAADVPTALSITATGATVSVTGSNTIGGDFTVAAAAAYQTGAGGADALDAGANTVDITVDGDIEIKDHTAGALVLAPGDDVIFTGTSSITGVLSVDAADRNIEFDVTAANGGATQVQIAPATASFGELSLTTTADIEALGGLNGVTVDASAANITLSDDEAIVLGAVTAGGNLSVTAAGSITDTAGRQISVAGTTSLAATDGSAGFFDIVLDNADGAVPDVHDFAENQTFSAEGEDIIVNDIDGIRLGDVTANASANDPTIASNDGSLTMQVGGAVTQTGTLTVPGALSITAEGFDTLAGTFFDIVLGGSNVIDGAVTLSGEDIELVNSGGLTLAALTARSSSNDTTITPTNAGEITLDAGGEITDGGSGTVIAPGELIVTAFDTTLETPVPADVTLGSGTHQIARLQVTDAAAVEVSNTGAIILNGIGTNGPVASLDLASTGAITQEAAVEVTGNVTLEGTGGVDILLDDSTNSIGGTIEIPVAGDVAISADSDFDLGGITLSANSDTTIDVVPGDDPGNLTVIAGAGHTITDSATLDVPGTARFENTGADITLDDGANSFGTLEFDTDANVLAVADGATEVGNVNAATLDLTIAGEISQASGTAISVTGTTSLTSAIGEDLVLDSTTNDFGDEVTIDGQTGTVTGGVGNVTLSDANTLTVGAITVDDIDAQGGFDTVSLNAADAVVLNGDINALLVSIGEINGGGIDFGNTGALALNVDAGDSARLVTPGASLELVTAGAIEVDGVDFSGFGGTTLLDGGSVTFAENASAFGNALDITSAGTVDQSVALTVTGDLIIDAAGQTVDLGGPGNQFSTVTATAGDLTLADDDAIVLGAITASGGLSVTAGDTITDVVGRAIDVTGATQLVATDGEGDFFDIALDNARTSAGAHRFGGTVDANGAAITLRASSGIDLGTVTARQGNDLIVDSGGNVTDSAAADITATGGIDIAANGNIQIDRAGVHEVEGTVTLSAGNNASFTAAAAGDDTLTLGAVDGGNGVAVTAESGVLALTDTVDGGAGNAVSLTGAGGIDQTGGTVSAGELALDAGGNTATLTQSGNDADVLSGGNGVIDYADDDALDLGEIDATALFVRAGGTISDGNGNTAVVVSGATSLLAQDGATHFDIRLDNVADGSPGAAPAHDLTGPVTVTGGDIEIVTSGTLTMGEVVAVANSDTLIAANDGSVTLQSGNENNTGGDIVATSEVTVPGAFTARTAGGAVTVVNAGNTLGSFAANTNLDTSGPAEVAVQDSGALELGAIVAQDLTVTSGGAVTQTAAVTAQGDATVTANGDITLTDPGNDLSDEGTGALSVSGDNVALADADSVAIGASNVASLSVSATDVAIEDAVDVTGTASFTNAGMSDLVFGAAAADADAATFEITDADIANLTAPDIGLVTQDGAAKIESATLASNLDIDSGAGGVAFGDAPTSITGNLSILSAGTVDQTAPLSVSGSTGIDAVGQTVELNDMANDFASVAATAADITLVDASGILLDTIDASADLTVSAKGDITQSASDGEVQRGVRVGGATNLMSSGDIVLADALNDFDANDTGPGQVDAAAVNIILNDRDALILGTFDATGDATVTAGGAISDSAGGEIIIDGSATLRAGENGEFDITLDNADLHDFADASGPENVSLTGNSIVIDDIDGLNLGGVDAGGDLTVRTGGDLTQSSGTQVVVGGSSSLEADGSGSDILLGESNDFHGSDESLAASATDILVVDSGDLVLGDIDAGGGFTAEAGGTLTDDGNGAAIGDDIDVAGTTSLSAVGEIVLNDVLNDFDGGEVDAVAPAVTLVDRTGIVLGAIDTGSLAVTAAGDITDFAGDAIRVTGATSLLAKDGGTDFDILLDNDNLHDFSDLAAAFTATGANIVVNDLSGLRFGDIRASGDLTVLADSDVLQFANTSLLIAGVTQVSADGSGSNVNLSQAANDFDTDGSGDRVDVSGENIVLTDANDIVLGDVDARGSLDVFAGGAISDDGTSLGAGSDVNVAGATSLTAADGIVLDDPQNDFDEAGSGAGEVSAAADSLVLTDVDDIVLGAITLSGDLSVTAGGDVIDDPENGENAIEVGGSTSILADDGSVLYDVLIDNPDIHDFADSGAAFTATGANIAVDDRDGIELGEIRADGALSVFAGAAEDADIVQTAGTAISVTGQTSLLAEGAGSDIILTNAANNFDSDAGGNGEPTEEPTDIFLAIQETEGDGIVVDPEGPSNETGGNNDADATDEVDAIGANVAITDIDAIDFGTVVATEDFTVRAGGSVTDSPDQAITVIGTTTVLAESNGDFFDIKLGAGFGDTTPRLHDFNIVTLQGEDVRVDDINAMELRNPQRMGNASGTPDLTIQVQEPVSEEILDGSGSVEAKAGGDLRFDLVQADGLIHLTATEGDFVIAANSPDTPVSAGLGLKLTAPAGSFAIDGEEEASRGRLREGLTFETEANNLHLDFGLGFTVVDEVEDGGTTLTLSVPDTPELDTGQAIIEIDSGFLLIGSQDFVDEAELAGFNPFLTLFDVKDQAQLEITGDLVLLSGGGVTVHIQNTSDTPNVGEGAIVDGTSFIGGTFSAVSLFGVFEGVGDQNAALTSFSDASELGLSEFVRDNNNTANGCVILLPSACQPIGSLTLQLSFNDGLLLSVTFVDPAADQDDPFSNRGDEEEWE